jgi:glycosyltransferase involved in cell wall biosynthesis
MPAVSLIIPAHNEAPYIGAVLAPAIESGLFTEVIVVDDGSSDGTHAAAEKQSGVRVIRLDSNRGKARALAAGLAEAKHDVIAFLDADIVGMTTDHLAALVQPVINGSSPATIAVFRGGRFATDFSHWATPYISGQRCIRRDALAGFTRWNDVGFGIEVALNDYLRRSGITQQVVPWVGVTQVMKEEKRGWLRGIGGRLAMYWDILRYRLRLTRSGDKHP